MPMQLFHDKRMMNVAIILWFGVAASVGAQMTPCKTNYSSITLAIEALDVSTFPTDKFNAACLKEACPELSRASCPFNKTLNQTALTYILQAVESCLSAQRTLCQTPIDPIPMCTAGLSLQTSLPTLPISGQAYNVAGKGFFNGINTTSLTSGPGGVYVTLSSPNLQYNSVLAGNVVLGNQPGSDNITLGPLPFTVNLNLSQVLQLNFSPLNFELASTAINVGIQVGDLFNSSENSNPIAAAFTQVLIGQVQNTLQSSPFPQDYFRFISAIL